MLAEAENNTAWLGQETQKKPNPLSIFIREKSSNDQVNKIAALGGDMFRIV